MTKKNKIIIGIAVAVVAIITVIAGITVNNHQKAVKEAESASVSVEASKTDLISSYTKQFEEIISKEYNTAEEYESAKKSLLSIKEKINASDIKDDERLVTLMVDIDKTIEEYDGKIKDLTTTTTEPTTESTTESITEKVTEKETKKQNNTIITRKSGSSSNTNNKSNNNNSNNNNTKPATKAETTTKKKNYKPAPAYGTVVTSRPNWDDYEDYCFHGGYITYTWKDGEWHPSECNLSGLTTMTAEKAYERARPYASEPNRKGAYEGEKVEQMFWIWTGD